MNLLDKARSFSRLFDLYGTSKKVSQITGIDETSVIRYIKVDKLPNEVKNLISKGKITSYHVAAELLSISEKKRLVETAEKIQGLPREVAREAIRYVKKSKKIAVNDCIDELMTFYHQYLDINVYVFKKNELFKNLNLDISIIINELQALFMDKYLTKLKITNIIDGEDYMFMMEKNENMNYNINNFKKLILKHIGGICDRQSMN